MLLRLSLFLQGSVFSGTDLLKEALQKDPSLKAYADEHQVIVRLEEFRLHIRRKRELASMRVHFFLQLQTRHDLSVYLKEAQGAIEKIRHRNAGEEKEGKQHVES